LWIKWYWRAKDVLCDQSFQRLDFVTTVFIGAIRPNALLSSSIRSVGKRLRLQRPNWRRHAKETGGRNHPARANKCAVMSAPLAPPPTMAIERALSNRASQAEMRAGPQFDKVH
jgi:hypothetical protein